MDAERPGSPASNPYLALTSEFNVGRLRALLSSGQAVVIHRLAVMSKDGDWILREDDEALSHVRGVLAAHGAQYRFGAPLDLRWLRHGWSSHLEFRDHDVRLRTDFVTRPARIDDAQLAGMWRDAERSGNPVVGAEPLASIKLTNREKDYAVVGELARLMTDPRAQLLFSRSSRDLIRIAGEHESLIAGLAPRRPLLRLVDRGREILDAALDQERRELMRINEVRLVRYRDAAAAWQQLWPSVARECDATPLPVAHAILVARATGVLPEDPARA